MFLGEICLKLTIRFYFARERREDEVAFQIYNLDRVARSLREFNISVWIFRNVRRIKNCFFPLLNRISRNDDQSASFRYFCRCFEKLRNVE